jgi:hypothetical protein
MFVGMDLHKSYLPVAVLDGKGKVLKNSSLENTWLVFRPNSCLDLNLFLAAPTRLSTVLMIMK